MAATGLMLNLGFDTTDLIDLADDIARIADADLRGIRQASVNAVALTVNRKSVDAAVKDLNLTRDYVEGRIARDEANGGAAKAYVRSMVRGTTMQQFGSGPRTLKQPVNWTNDQIMSMGRKFGDWPGWTRRTGDQFANRNIPANMKSRGIAAQVKRSGPEGVIDRGFVMPLKRGREAGGNGFGVFARSKDGTIKHRYGPSVYQTFRRYIQDDEPNISASLQDEFTSRLDEKLKDLMR